MRQLFGLIALPFLLAAAPPQPSPVLTGQVVDGDGRPVAEAQVQAVALDFQRGGTEPPAKRRTDKDGRFRLDGFPAGTELALQASAEGFAPSIVRASMETSAPLEKTPGKPEAKPKPPLRIVLGRGSTLTGRIVDPQGRPAGGAEVVLSASFDGPDSMIRFAFDDPTQRVTADPKGRFRIERLGPGAFQLQADHPPFAPATQPRIKIPDKPAEIALGDIRLLPAALLEGQVTDERGAPVAGASVTLRPTDGDFMAFHGGQAVEPVQTDADGYFRSGRLAVGTRVNVSVEHPAYVDAHAPGVEVPAAEPLLVTLQAGRSLSGRVVDPAGKPVTGAELRPAPEIGIGAALVHSMRGSPRTMSAEDGRFVLDGLSPGPLALWVIAEGYRMETVRGLRIPETGEAPPLEIVLKQGATVEGRVLDERSRPVAGAFVHADPVQGYSDASVPAQSGSHTDEDGRYQVSGLPSGRLRVAAQTSEGRQAEGIIEIAEGATGVHPLDLRLDTGFPVSGRVLDETGAPVAGATLQLTFSAQPRIFQKSSGADGSFLFSNVPAGSWRLSASAPGFAETDLPGEIRVGEGPATAGIGIELRLERGGTITGQVLGLAPEDLARVQISAFRSEEGIQPQLTPPGSVDPAGRYRIDGLRPGTWQVLGMLPRSRQARGTVQVTGNGEESVLDLRFTEGATLSGRLLLDGRPLASAMIVLTTPQPSAGPDNQQASSRHDGSFSFEGVSPGSYRLILIADLVVESRNVEVAADQEMVVELASGSAEVTVLSAGGTSLGRTSLQIARELTGIEPLSLPARLFTDDRGLVELPRLAAGTYVIQAVHAGSESPPQRFQVTPGGTTEVQVVMP